MLWKQQRPVDKNAGAERSVGTALTVVAAACVIGLSPYALLARSHFANESMRKAHCPDATGSLSVLSERRKAG